MSHTTTPPLHLRCGDDLRERLPRAGVAGAGYLCFADPICQGPAREDADPDRFLARRARFVAAHAGIPPAAARERLGAEYAALRALRRHDGPVWLWFEHDLWDQAALIRVLSLLAEAGPAPRRRLFLVPADGARAFSELDDAALAALRPAPLTEAQMQAACDAWRGFAAGDPRGLAAPLRTGRLAVLPHLAPALRRHLKDLPWTADGLALSERNILRALRDGAATGAALLDALRRADPLFPPTDLILRAVLRRLTRPAPRAPALARADGPRVTLTAHGAGVLDGTARHVPARRWLGGAAIGPASPWRWDLAAEGVVAV